MFKNLLTMMGEYSSFETFTYDKYTASTLHEWSKETLFSGIVEDTPAGGEVLDVGCGGGQFAIKLKQDNPELKLTGVDVTPEMIELAQERSEESRSDIDFDEGDVMNLPYESNRFDYLISLGSIKHWPDRTAGFKECVRVLKPGGTFKIIELDRSREWSEYYNFLHNLNHPPVIRELFFPIFLYVVKSQAMDENTYQSIVDDLGRSLDDVSIYPAEKTADYKVPLIVLEGTKNH